MGRLAPASPRWVRPEWRYACRSQHPPQRLLPQVDLAPGDQPVHGQLRADRDLRVRGGIRFTQAATAGPSYPRSAHQPSHDSTAARRAFHVLTAASPHSCPRAPQISSSATVASGRASPRRSAVLPTPIPSDRSVFALSSGSRNTSAAARTVNAFPTGSRTTAGTAYPLPQITGPLRAQPREHRRRSWSAMPQIQGVICGRLQTDPAADHPSAAHQGRSRLSAGFRSDVPQPPRSGHPSADLSLHALG
ncbi:hypothetical protein BN159_0286 [Streptomyces davaonensis JCM 4913]|uniref:Uncharacterized protein n=1 Tax=Streptomyces davaonensis (strain DSM 101723 / JCM 4913 / KCC S-0913 / 768) TaxID=1214101 RepID=K4QV16_STRDJ|nr:hypothetical protein BN159_0286 [Streptomyces davaonensis JCM 4913]